MTAYLIRQREVPTAARKVHSTLVIIKIEVSNIVRWSALPARVTGNTQCPACSVHTASRIQPCPCQRASPSGSAANRIKPGRHFWRNSRWLPRAKVKLKTSQDTGTSARGSAARRCQKSMSCRATASRPTTWQPCSKEQASIPTKNDQLATERGRDNRVASARRKAPAAATNEIRTGKFTLEEIRKEQTIS